MPPLSEVCCAPTWLLRGPWGRRAHRAALRPGRRRAHGPSGRGRGHLLLLRVLRLLAVLRIGLALVGGSVGRHLGRLHGGGGAGQHRTSYHITGQVARASVCLQKGLHGWMLPVISCTA